MIYKTITLKFAGGRSESAFIVGKDERSCARQIEALVKRKGAVGWSTQSTSVHPGR